MNILNAQKINNTIINKNKYIRVVEYVTYDDSFANANKYYINMTFKKKLHFLGYIKDEFRSIITSLEKLCSLTIFYANINLDNIVYQTFEEG